MVHAPRLAPLGGEAAFSAVQVGPEILKVEPRLDEALKSAPGVSLFRRTGSGAANPTTQGLSLRAIAPSGAGRALVTLDEESIRKWAGENGVPGKTYAEIVTNPKVKAHIQTYFDKLNKELPSYETIKYFAILPADLSIDAGELTPSMKVKRKFVEKKFMTILDEFYKDQAA